MRFYGHYAANILQLADNDRINSDAMKQLIDTAQNVLDHLSDLDAFGEDRVRTDRCRYSSRPDFGGV